jgi:hypothetical protein
MVKKAFFPRASVEPPRVPLRAADDAADAADATVLCFTVSPRLSSSRPPSPSPRAGARRFLFRFPPRNDAEPAPAMLVIIFPAKRSDTETRNLRCSRVQSSENDAESAECAG